MTEPHKLFGRLRDAGSVNGPAMTFVSSDGKETSYDRDRLFATTAAIAADLKQTVNPTGRRRTNGIVGLLLTSQEEQVLHLLACLEAGLAPAILTPHNRKLERGRFLNSMARVLDQVAPIAVVTDTHDELAETLNRSAKTQAPMVLTARSCRVMADGWGKTRELRSDTAFVQFSSGTTGIKKAVEVSDAAMGAQLDAYGSALHIRQGADDREIRDVIVNWLPLYHDMGYFTSVHLPLTSGAHSVLINPLDWVSDPAMYLRAVHRHGGTLSWHPNFAFAFMAKRIRDEDIAGVDLSSIRALVNCSEPVTFVSQSNFANRFNTHGLSNNAFTGCYAMAETVFAVTHGVRTQSDALDNNPPGGATVTSPRVSVGKPLPGARVRIIDAGSETELPEREIGEIAICAPFLASGYLDTAATRAAFVDGEYRTGDLGYLDNGQLYVCGRKKDMIIVAGNNVFPEDIEAIIGATDGIRDGRVVAGSKFDKRLQTERVIVLAEQEYADEPVDLTVAIDRMSAELGLDGVRIELVRPEFLIKSSSGKLSRAASLEKWSG